MFSKNAALSDSARSGLKLGGLGGWTTVNARKGLPDHRSDKSWGGFSRYKWNSRNKFALGTEYLKQWIWKRT